VRRAAARLEDERRRDAAARVEEASRLRLEGGAGLAACARRLRQDEEYLAELRQGLRQATEDGALARVLGPVLASLRQEGLHEAASPGAQLLAWAMDRLDGWLRRRACGR